MKSILKLLPGIILVIILLVVGYLLVDATINDYSPAPYEQLACDGSRGDGVLPDTLSVMIWNLGYAGLGSEMDFFYDGGKRVRPEERYFRVCQQGIKAWLRQQEEMDFILLQEVDLYAKRSYYGNQAEMIGGLFPEHCSIFATNYRVKFVPVPLGRPMGRVHSGIMTLGKVPPASAERVSLPGSFGWPKRLFMLDRCLLVSRYPLSKGKELVLINLHNSAFDDTGELRHQELGSIYQLITAEYDQGNYVIAGGDWNMNPPGFDPDLIRNDSVFTVRHGVDDGFLPPLWQWVWDPAVPTNRDVSRTYTRTETGTTLIDFFLISPNVELLRVEGQHLGFEFSDHHPVMLQVRLRHTGVTP
jgi:endonuclease/exonuclease/phosphatase family metal-dependent hydrolase